MDRSLDSLSSEFLPRACVLIARIVGRGLPVMIIQTGRTVEEHKANLAAGTSRAQLSKHLPRYLRWDVNFGILLGADRDKADAIDLAPYDQFNLHGPDKLKWDTRDAAWGIIGQEAEKLNLRWGGRWLSPFDPGHVELVLPGGEPQLVNERSRAWPSFQV